jgi:hypothetical protein
MYTSQKKKCFLTSKEELLKAHPAIGNTCQMGRIENSIAAAPDEGCYPEFLLKEDLKCCIQINGCVQ